MARACKLSGGVLVAVGLVAVLALVTLVVRDQAYHRAALAYDRNPGNVMYEAEFKGAQVRRAFELVGAGLGLLLALNGATLCALGIVATRHAGRTPGDSQSGGG